MNTFRFGNTPKKTYEVNEDGTVAVISKWYGGGTIEIKDIKTIFIESLTIDNTGKVYISTDGSCPYENPVIDKNGFIFNENQQDQVAEFIALLSKENTAIDIDYNKKLPIIAKEVEDPNVIKCPNCGSKNVEFLDNNRKAFSVGKAVGGAVLTGGVGVLAGFAGKKGKDRWRCEDCGTVFEK